MIFDAPTALIWILFLALFPMTYIWLRRAWQIFIKKDYSEVALKGGMPPENPEKWAIAAGLINLAAGLVTFWIISGLILFVTTGINIGNFQKFAGWNALAGSTIWIKLFADLSLKMMAHPLKWGRKKQVTESR